MIVPYKYLQEIIITNLQENIRTLCTEFKDTFSNELPAEPAKIEPFNLVVDGMVHTPYQERLPYRVTFFVTFLVWCMDSSSGDREMESTF